MIKPYYEEPKIKIYQGHILEVLKTLDDESVNTIITSPPYWGLRDYGEDTKTIWGGANCEHQWDAQITKQDNLRFRPGKNTTLGNFINPAIYTDNKSKSGFCSKCNAWHGQLGLEPTLDLYINHLLQITAELKRVLRKDGIMFWNQGDSYSGSGCGTNDYRTDASKSISGKGRNALKYQGARPHNKWQAAKLPAKCLCLQNYRLILQMIDEQGWILRNSIIWNKPNHMPSSVKDRFSNAYEPVFMLVKNKKYWFDLDAVRLPHSPDSHPFGKDGSFDIDADKPTAPTWGLQGTQSLRGKKFHRYRLPTGKNPGDVWEIREEQEKAIKIEGKIGSAQRVESFFDKYGGKTHPLGKNPSDCWTIPTQPFPEAHFATFPEDLVKPMILAGCPRWICKKCGKARVRTINRTVESPQGGEVDQKRLKGGVLKSGGKPTTSRPITNIYKESLSTTRETIGWTDCGCNAGWTPGIVLDPFVGAGAVLRVTKNLGYAAIGIDIKKDYCNMSIKRIKNITPSLPFE